MSNILDYCVQWHLWLAHDMCCVLGSSFCGILLERNVWGVCCRPFAFPVSAFMLKTYGSKKKACWYAMGWATGWGPKSICLWWWWRENYFFHRE